MAIAALLHDSVEDHGGRPMLKVIEAIFGARVAKIVDDAPILRGRSEEEGELGSGASSYLHRVCHEDAETRFVSAPTSSQCARRPADLRYDGEVAFAALAPRQRRCGTTVRW